MKSGFVSIIGRPNVGKSTLLNNILNKKVAITSDKVGTTRNIIYGIYNEKDTQIIFIDTPGIGKAKDKLGTHLNKKAYQAIENDLVLFLIDSKTGFGKNDEKILEKLKQENKKVILVLNKIDTITKEKLLNQIIKIKDLYNFLDIVPVSGLKKKNTQELIKVIKKHLPDNIKYFEDDITTNTTKEFMIAEIIREKALMLTKEEVPHSITTLVESLTIKKGTYHINALIIVDRNNLKSIIIGKNGQMLKKIGTLARKDIENYLNKKVYLELFVKTIENWKQKESIFEYLKINEKDL